MLFEVSNLGSYYSSLHVTSKSLYLDYGDITGTIISDQKFITQYDVDNSSDRYVQVYISNGLPFVLTVYYIYGWSLNGWKVIFLQYI